MQSKLVSSQNPRIWILVLASGEEAKKTIVEFAQRERPGRAASFAALGAFACAKLGYFDWHKKEYLPIPLMKSSLWRHRGKQKNESDLHAHAVLGRRDGSIRGGHLMEGVVRPTLEVTLTETPAHLKRRMHPEINVALIDIA